jgi:hypothetical protein
MLLHRTGVTGIFSILIYTLYRKRSASSTSSLLSTTENWRALAFSASCFCGERGWEPRTEVCIRVPKLKVWLTSIVATMDMAALCLLVYLVDNDLTGGFDESGDSSGHRFPRVVGFVRSSCVIGLVLEDSDQFKGSMETTLVMWS